MSRHNAAEVVGPATPISGRRLGPKPAAVDGEKAASLSSERRRRTRHPSSPIAGSLTQVALLILPDPDLVPSIDDIAAMLTDDVRDACLAELHAAHPKSTRVEAVLRHALPSRPARAQSRIRFMVETGQPADPATHDEFFRIGRSKDHAPATFILGLFKALDILRGDLESTPTTLDAGRLQSLAGAFGKTLALALGNDGIAETFCWKAPKVPATDDYSVRRWVRGHQLFACLSQGLLFAFQALGEADRAARPQDVRKAASLIAALLEASACSLELTGDFPEALYSQSIRVSMESPFLPTGFSGLLSDDHRQLVLRMKLLRPVIERLRDQQHDLHALIFEKLNAVYASHKHVCARFVGPAQSSLLMSQSSSRSAVEQIERFRQMRVRSWGTPDGSDA